MSLTIELTPEEEEPLERAAKQEGLEPERYAHSLLSRTPPHSRRGLIPPRLSPEEAIRALDAIAESYRGIPAPSPEAYERASLYEGFPEWPTS